MTNMKQKIIDALEKTEISSSCRLTRLVDGEEEYTAKIGGEERKFETMEDAQEWISDMRRKYKVDAVLSALKEPTEGMTEAANLNAVCGCCLVTSDVAEEVWELMIEAAEAGK